MKKNLLLQHDNFERIHFKDEFNTGEAAPIASPRAPEPGPPDQYAVVQSGGNLSIVNGILNVPAGTSTWDGQEIIYGPFSPASGLAVVAAYNFTTRNATIAGAWSTSSNRSPQANNVAVWYQQSGLSRCCMNYDDARRIDLLNTPLSTYGEVLIALREGGGAWFWVGGGDLSYDYELVLVRDEDAVIDRGDEVWLGLSNHSGALTVPLVEILDLSHYAPEFSSRHGGAIVPQRISTAGELYTHGVDDFIIYAYWTPQAAETFDVRIRLADGDYIAVRCTQSTGRMDLYEVVDSTPTLFGSGATVGWTPSTEYLITVEVDGTTISARQDNGVISATGTSSLNSSATGGQISLAGSQFEVWKRRWNFDFPFRRDVVVDDSLHNAFPGVSLRSDGSWLCAYRVALSHGADDKGVLWSKTSNDCGRTWSAASQVFSHATYDARDPCLTTLSTGTIICSYAVHDNGVGPGIQVYTIRSTNDGVSWDTPVRVDTGHNEAHVSAPVVELGSGELILPLYVEDGSYWYAVLYRSNNGGTSWTKGATIATQAGQNTEEPNVVILPSGDLLCMTRSPDNIFRKVTSDDDGLTWGSLTTAFTEASGPPRMIVDDSDHLHVAYREKRGKGDMLALRYSADEGATWSEIRNPHSSKYSMTYASWAEQGNRLVLVWGIEPNANSDSDIVCMNPPSIALRDVPLVR